MRTVLTNLQANILDQDVYTDMSWLFEIDLGDTGSVDYYLSTKEKTWGGQTYSDIDGSDTFILDFTPIKMRHNYADQGILAPDTMEIVLDNKSSSLVPSTFEGAAITVRLIIKSNIQSQVTSDVTLSSDITAETQNSAEVEIASWGFVVRSAYSVYQELHLDCVDWVSKYMEGEYPNTPLISTLWTAANVPDDNVCVPKIFGTCYFPIRWTKADVTGDDLYVLGEYNTGQTHTITECADPTDIGISVYSKSDTNNTFTITEDKQANDNNYYGTATFVITEGGSNIFWERNKHPDMPCKYSYSQTVNITNPIQIIKEVLDDMGIPSAKINTASYNEAYEVWRSRGLRFNAPFWYKRPRSEVLAHLLMQCNTRLLFRNQIFFKVNTTAVQHTINNSWIIKPSEVGKGTFSYRSLNITAQKDSGHILYRPTDKCIDNHLKLLIAAKTTTNYISEETLDCLFISDSRHAMKIGKMALQRALLPEGRITALLKPKCLQIECGDMVNIEGANYNAISAVYPVLIDEISINRDGSVNVTAVTFSDTLDDWGDITYNAIVPIEDNSTGGFYSVYSGKATPGGTSNLYTLDGSIKLPAGEDIILEGSDSDPAILKWQGIQYDTILGATSSGDELTLVSSQNGTGILNFGHPDPDFGGDTDGGLWSQIYVYAEDILLLDCNYNEESDTPHMYIKMTPLTGMEFFWENDGTDYTIRFASDAFFPRDNNSIKLGASGAVWSELWVQNISLLERSSDPSEPAEGYAVIWMSDGTGKGDDGDVLIASKAGGTTKWGTLFDHSAGNAW